MDNISGNELAHVLAHIWTKYENKLEVPEQMALSFAIAAVDYCEGEGKEFTIKDGRPSVADKEIEGKEE